MSKSNHGGPRPGSGRPKEPETKIIAFRVRLAEEKEVRAAVKKTISELRKKLPIS